VPSVLFIPIHTTIHTFIPLFTTTITLLDYFYSYSILLLGKTQLANASVL